MRPFAHWITLFGTPGLALDDRTAGWGPLAPAGLEIEDLPGSHESAMRQPLVKTLAVSLKRHLQIAQDREKTL
jgi:thioesterase domain-containing protein